MIKLTMLSDKDILAAINDGQLTISPFDKKQLRPAGISLHLGDEISVPQPIELVDVREDTDIPYASHKLSDDKPFILHPQQFVLGHTLEIISVGTKLGFLIEGRSTLARLGISVEQSSTIVDPGHTERPITLELYNCGPSPVALYPSMSIAKALVFRLSSQTSRHYDSYARYGKQKKGVGKPILREHSE